MSYLIIELETQLLKTGKTSSDLIRATGHTPANISKLRNGKIKAIRLKTLLEICDELDCQPRYYSARERERARGTYCRAREECREADAGWQRQ